MTIKQKRLLSLLSTFLLLPTLIAFTPTVASAQLWTVLTFDRKGDGRDPLLGDAAQLAYRYDKEQDTLWFRVNFFLKPNEKPFLLNILIDTGGDYSKKWNWWGGNRTFRFDRLISAKVTRTEKGYVGRIIGDKAAIVPGEKTFGEVRNNLQIRGEGDSIVIGVKRTELTDKLKLNVIASVGALGLNGQWSDDIPNSGDSSIDLATAKPGVMEIDVGRNNLKLPAGYKTLPDNKPPLIIKKGNGKQTLILVPGMYSGTKSFDGFIARNQSRYKIYLLTPPGLNGTPSRVAPSVGKSFSEMTWTRRLEQDILDLIRREKLKKPVIVAERQPAAQAAMELAIEHPEQIGGVVLVGTNLVQFFPASNGPTRRTPIAFADRGPLVDESWAEKWFKYVTPETWKNGDLTKQLLSNEPSRAQLAWDELEAAPVEVKIRYLCEFWASDVTRGFDRLKVPVLALVPAFDEKFLADPTNGFAKPAFLDSWETLVPKHPLLEIVKIPNARMLVLDDQPQEADDAVAAFVKKVN